MSKVFKDLYGQPLEIGDPVAFNPPKYKGLMKGTVIGFTPKMVTVQYQSQFRNADGAFLDKHHCYPSDVVKVTVFAVLSQK